MKNSTANELFQAKSTIGLSLIENLPSSVIIRDYDQLKGKVKNIDKIVRKSIGKSPNTEGKSFRILKNNQRINQNENESENKN